MVFLFFFFVFVKYIDKGLCPPLNYIFLFCLSDTSFIF